MKHPTDLAPGSMDAIVVLGCALREDGSPGKAMKERLDTAALLHRAGVAPRVAVCGGRRWNGHIEAHVMGRYLFATGIPREQIIVEDRSTNTAENAQFAADMLRHKATSVCLVTQPVHLPRALFFFRKTSLRPVGVLLRESYQLSPPYIALLRGFIWELGGCCAALVRSVGQKPRTP